MQNNTEAKIRIEHIHDLTRLNALQSTWDSILQQNSVKSIFLTREWASAWWKNYGEDKELWLLAAWDEDLLVGIAPLMLIKKRKYGLMFRVLKPLSAPDCDVSGFLLRDESLYVLNAFCKYILDQQRLWDVIQVSEFRQDNPQTGFLLEHFSKAGFKTHITTSQHFYIPIEGDWQTYFDHTPKNLKHDITRRLKHADRLGKLSLRHIKGRDVTWENFQTIFQINETGHFTDLYKSTRDQNFHHDLMESMQERGWIDIYFLYLDDAPLAFRYGFIYENRFEDWRASFNQLHPQLSSGKLLMQKTLEDQFNHGYKEFDFLRGTDTYKTRWHPLPREYAAIRLASIKRVAAWLAFIGIATLKRWFKDRLGQKQNENWIPDEE